jgi:transcriptional regulator with XRE-family HTH domain
VTVTTISRYEFGLRTPPPAFIYHTAQCLHLSDDQIAALLNALTMDLVAHYLQAYTAFLEGVQQQAQRKENV